MTKQKKTAALFVLAFAALTEVLVMLSYERGTLVMQYYTGPLTFAFVGMTLFAGEYHRRWSDWAGAAFVGWFVLSRVLMGELYLEYSYLFLCNMSCIYLLAYPFARTMQDGEKQAGLRTFAWVYSGAFTLFAWFGVLVVIGGESVTLPLLGTQVGLTQYGRFSFNSNPNISSVIFLCAFLLTLWLVLRGSKTRLQLAAGGFALLGQYLGIGMTCARTSIAIASVALAALPALYLLKKLKKKQWIVRWSVALATALVVFAAGCVCFAGVPAMVNRVKETVPPAAASQMPAQDGMDREIRERSLLYKLDTLNKRTDFYKLVPQIISENPDMLATGWLNSELVRNLRDYGKWEHGHNSYIHTLFVMGLPGVALALWFTALSLKTAWTAVMRCGEKGSLADQFVCVLPSIMLLAALVESFLFTEYLTLYGMTYALVLGYALEIERRLKQA